MLGRLEVAMIWTYLAALFLAAALVAVGFWRRHRRRKARKQILRRILADLYSEDS